MAQNHENKIKTVKKYSHILGLIGIESKIVNCNENVQMQELFKFVCLKISVLTYFV